MATADYIRDIGVLLRDLALEARARELRDKTMTEVDPASEAFDQGKVMAFYECITLMLHEAEIFGLSQDEIGLAGFDPDRELLGSKEDT